MYPVYSKINSNNNNQLAPAAVKGDNDKNRLIDLTIQHFQQIVIDSNERANNCKELKDYSVKELLSKGIWYPIDYYKALKKFNQKERLN